MTNDWSEADKFVVVDICRLDAALSIPLNDIREVVLRGISIVHLKLHSRICQWSRQGFAQFAYQAEPHSSCGLSISHCSPARPKSCFGNGFRYQTRWLRTKPGHSDILGDLVGVGS